MSKTLFLLMLVLILAISLSGCGGGDEATTIAVLSPTQAVTIAENGTVYNTGLMVGDNANNYG